MSSNSPIRQLEIIGKDGTEYTPFGADAENVIIPVEKSNPTTLQAKATEWDTKLRAVAGAQPNKIETISVNGSVLPINNKNVEIGSVGHIITNNSGTVMTKRDKLQFKNLKVSDDGTTGSTVVEGPTFTVQEAKEIGTLKITF
jgi:hypothetical protein